MKERALITGIYGSGSSYVAEHILENYPEVQVWGIARWHSNGVLRNIKNIKDRLIIRECDLNDISSVIRVLKECMPSKVLHMASTANVRTSFDTPLSVMQNNVMGTANLFEAIRMVCPETVIQLCSTSEVYGNPVEYPMTENHPMRPVNPYSASKLGQEAVAYAWSQSWKLKTVITRSFAYLNFKRKDIFSTAFALQVARIEAGKQSVLKHGNLDSIRTLMHVSDMASAYWVACEKCDYNTPYNIGGKDVISVGEFLDILKGHAKVEIPCEEDKLLLRPKDVDRQVCDVSKFLKKTGWQPKYNLEESILKLLNDCREEVKSE